jgi:hypothetical protein
MNKQRNKLAVVLITSAFAAPVLAGGSAQHFSNAVNHSGQALGHSTVAGLKLVSGAASVPLLITGEVGKASGELGEALWDEANTELPIGEDVITAGPSPAEAVNGEE